MAINYKKTWNGVTVVPKTATASSLLGELETLSSTNKIYFHNGTSNSPIVTEAHSASLTNKAIDADLNTITNIENADIKALAAIDATKIADGSVSNTEFQYLDGVTSPIQGQIDAKLTSTLTDAHIFVGNGSNVATDVAVSGDVTLANTGNFQIATGAIVDADINATAAIDATKIANGTVTNTEFQYLDGVTSSIQTQLDGKVTGPGSSTDNAITRFDGTTGGIVQNSVVTISDTGAATGFTTVDASGTITGGNLTTTGTTSTGSFSASGTFDANGLVQYASANDAATGSNVTLTTPTTKVIRLTNASLVSIDGIPAGADAQEVIIENATGTTVVINEDTGGTAANRFYTGTTAGISLADKASLYLSYDSTSSRWRVIGGSGSGTGSQSLDTFVQLDASELLTNWATGDNATFLGGGTLAGTFVKETSSPLNGTASYKYTQAASSLDDYLASPVQSVPVRFRGNMATCTFPYLYDGTSSDIEPIVYDVTNAAKLTTSTNLLPSTGTNTSIYKVNVNIPSTCTQIRVGFQVKALNSGKILQFDDIQVGSDTTKYSDVQVVTQWQSYTPTFTGFGTAASIEFQWRQNGQNVDIRGKFTTGTTTAVEARVTLPNSYTSAGTTIIPSIQMVGNTSLSVANSTYFTSSLLIEPAVSYMTMGVQTSTASEQTKALGTAFGNGTVVELFASVPIAGLSASNPQIISASESFSTDTASLVYAGSATYTLTTLADAPIGTFITFTYASSTNTRTQTTTAPTQTTSSMNTNGIQIFTRAYNAASTAGNPALVAIQIGKNLKGVSLNLYKSTGKVTAGSIDSFQADSGVRYGAASRDYNELTGILLVDLGFNFLTTTTVANLQFTDATQQSNGYLTINASKSPALVGVPQVQPRFATISDVKAANTAGGTFTSGAFQTRTLNTLVDNSGLVTTLASNQFTLPAGEYYIEATAPAYSVINHKAKLRNITDSTDALIGSSAFTDLAGSDDVQTDSIIRGSVIITAAKVFEIQHQCNTTQATDGFGVASNFGVSEVYTTVKITKVK